MLKFIFILIKTWFRRPNSWSTWRPVWSISRSEWWFKIWSYWRIRRPRVLVRVVRKIRIVLWRNVVVSVYKVMKVRIIPVTTLSPLCSYGTYVTPIKKIENYLIVHLLTIYLLIRFLMKICFIFIQFVSPYH